MTVHNETFGSLYRRAFMAGLAPGWGIVALCLGTIVGMGLWGPAGVYLGTAALALPLFFDWRKTRREFMDLLPDGFLDMLVSINIPAITSKEEVLDESWRVLVRGTRAVHRSWFIRRWAGCLVGSLIGVLIAYQASPAAAVDLVPWIVLAAASAAGVAWILGTHLPAFFLARKVAR